MFSPSTHLLFSFIQENSTKSINFQSTWRLSSTKLLVQTASQDELTTHFSYFSILICSKVKMKWILLNFRYKQKLGFFLINTPPSAPYKRQLAQLVSYDDTLLSIILYINPHGFSSTPPRKYLFIKTLFNKFRSRCSWPCSKMGKCRELDSYKKH